jgi:transposase-like protein
VQTGLLSAYCSKCYPKGEIEVDESYFGGRKTKGKRERGASKKTPVFGILKRGRKVYTELNDSTFCLHQKEREFRFNLRDTDMRVMLLRMIRNNP